MGNFRTSPGGNPGMFTLARGLDAIEAKISSNFLTKLPATSGFARWAMKSHMPSRSARARGETLYGFTHARLSSRPRNASCHAE